MSDRFMATAHVDRERGALYYLGFDLMLVEVPIRDGVAQIQEAHVVHDPELRAALMRGEGEPVEETARYDISVAVPQGAVWKDMMRSALPAAFRIGVTRETRDTDVLLLNAPNVRIELEPIVGREAAVLLHVHRERRDRTVDGEPPVAISCGAGFETDAFGPVRCSHEQP